MDDQKTSQKTKIRSKNLEHHTKKNKYDQNNQKMLQTYKIYKT